jgi:hypothetical protein
MKKQDNFARNIINNQTIKPSNNLKEPTRLQLLEAHQEDQEKVNQSMMQCRNSHILVIKLFKLAV